MALPKKYTMLQTFAQLVGETFFVEMVVKDTCYEKISE